MYYNSNQNSNEYYSSYKKEMSTGKEHEPTNSLPLLIKVGLTALFLGALSVGSIYLVNYFSTEKKDIKAYVDTKSISTTDEIPKITLSEKNLPRSIQLQESESKIISQLKKNATDSLKGNLPNESKEHNAIKNEVIALKETSNMNSQDITNIVNLIIHKKSKDAKSSLEKELLNTKEESVVTKTLKETNHYNKIILSSKKENNQDQRIRLSNNLDALVNNSANKNISNYEKSLKSEVLIRSNEMRFIIVKKGDSLSKISKKAYGDIKSYRKIFKANPEIIKNPNQIFVGQRLRIPS